MRTSILIGLTTFIPITTIGLLHLVTGEWLTAAFVGMLLVATVLALIPEPLRDNWIEAIHQ